MPVFLLCGEFWLLNFEVAEVRKLYSQPKIIHVCLIFQEHMCDLLLNSLQSVIV